MTLVRQILALTILACVLMTFGCAAPEAENTSGMSARIDHADPAGDREEGQEAAGSRELPDGFPADFPLPPDFDIYESRFVPETFGTRANYFVRGKSSTSLAELVAYYRKRLPEAGFKLDHQPPDSAPAENAMFYFRNDAYSDCSIQLQREENLTDVLINLPLKDG
jgi:hypothetical protein